MGIPDKKTMREFFYFKKNICNYCSDCPFNIINGCGSFFSEDIEQDKMFIVGENFNNKYQHSSNTKAMNWEDTLIKLIEETKPCDFGKIQPLFEYAVKKDLYGIKIL